MRVLRIKTLSVAFAVATAVSLTIGASPVAAAGQPACGATITEDTTLTSNLTCPGNSAALTIAAPGVAVDLAGHDLRGSGVGTGIVVDSIDATIKNGTIARFNTGIFLPVDVAQGTTVQGMRITQNRSNGIATNGFDHGLRVLDNQIVSNGGDGILAGFGTDGALYQNNTIEKNGGNGMNISFSTSSFVSNVVSKNGANGILVDDEASFAPSYSFQGNSADKNAALGIEISIPDEGYVVNDLGGNVARKNGNPLQCVGPGIVCGQ